MVKRDVQSLALERLRLLRSLRDVFGRNSTQTGHDDHSDGMTTGCKDQTFSDMRR